MTNFGKYYTFPAFLHRKATVVMATNKWLPRCLWQISKSVQEKEGASTSQQPGEGETSTQQVPEDIFSYYEQMDKEEDEEEETQTVSFEIRQVFISDFCLLFQVFILYYDICVNLLSCLRLLQTVCSTLKSIYFFMKKKMCKGIKKRGLFMI